MARIRTLGTLIFVAALISVVFLTGVVNAAPAAMTQAEGMVTPVPPPAVTPGGALPGNPAIELVQVASGLADPVHVANAGDGSGRLFIVERIGRIRILDKDGTLLEQPFLDIQDAVKTSFLEQGLLGLAFHPNYAQNGLFYIYYADETTNGDLFLVQYHVSADDPNKADPDSAKMILATEGDPYVNHNGGSVRFGPDGYLYWTTGDGGLAGDPYDNAQNVRNQYGKIHRIDVDNTGNLPYLIPEDNPFAVSSVVNPTGFAITDPANYHPDAKAEIWAYGLRNPWSIDFDPKTGDLYIADVGQNAWEEIDFQAAGSPGGQNYGWDWLEGTHCYPETVSECPRSQVGVPPVAEYDHTRGDCSISGLGVSRDPASPTLDGIYFNSDFCSGRVWGLTRDASGTWVYQELLDTTLLVTSGGNGEAGDVYLASCNCVFDRTYNPLADPQGAIWRIMQADAVPAGAVTAPLEAAATPVAAASTAPAQATIDAYDIYFDPKALTIAANTDVTIALPNEGAASHNFSIDALGINVNLPPGQTQKVTINAPAGTYEYYCNVPGHKAAGMFGTLTVQ